MENDPLATYLDTLARDENFRVARVLKSAPHEITEVVFFRGAGKAEMGPFVRKRIRTESAMGDGYRRLFDAQQAGRRFRHLPRIYDVHDRGDELVVVMEYVAGRTLRDEVFECNPSLDLARKWFPLLCDAASEMHALMPTPLIHRDLKPTNVLVNGEDLVVIDFGISRTFRDGAEGDTTHFGTRAYAPPEQFGYGQTDARSDVYALGMILCYLLTERDPSPMMAREGFPDAEISPQLRPVLMRACAFDPAARFQSAQQLKSAFLDALEGTVRAVPSIKMMPVQGDESRAASQGKRASGSKKARNVAVVSFWALMILGCVGNIVSPGSSAADEPLWFRVLKYGGWGLFFFTGIAYAMLDKRSFKARFPLLNKPPFSWKFPFGLLLVLIGFAFMILCVALVNVGLAPPFDSGS